MSDAKHITILSGGGSPHGVDYRPVYQLIADEAPRRGFSVHLVDYVGIGHFPDFGVGLNLPDAVEKARKDIKGHHAPSGSTLLCRSFGCDVGAYLLAHHSEEMMAFSRIILWGPSGLNTYWDLVARAPDSLGTFNKHAEQKGVQLNENFWASMLPIEETVKGIKGITVEIAYGTKDKYCTAAFAHYLAQICWKHTPCPVRVVEIVDAQHEIRANDDARIVSDYFELIFGVVSRSRITNPES